MDLRLALYELAAEHKLDARATDRLEQLAGLHDEPSRLAYRLARAVAASAAALAGLGLIFWIAAQWGTMGRLGQFALLQGFLLTTCLGALLRPAGRVPLGLLSLLIIGGLFAYFGQTYQTGADAWQLFALWAVLALPLCLGVRSDVLWAPWSLVVMTAVSLWMRTHTGHGWRFERDDLMVHLVGWSIALAATGLLSMRFQSFTGADTWAHRTAITLTAVIITSTALGGLFSNQGGMQYGLGLLALVAAAMVLALSQSFDVYGLSAVALGINTLLVAGFARLIFTHHSGGDGVGSLLMIGLLAAGLLAFSVSALLRLTRLRQVSGDIA